MLISLSLSFPRYWLQVFHISPAFSVQVEVIWLECCHSVWFKETRMCCFQMVTSHSYIKWALKITTRSA